MKLENLIPKQGPLGLLRPPSQMGARGPRRDGVVLHTDGARGLHLLWAAEVEPNSQLWSRWLDLLIT